MAENVFEKAVEAAYLSVLDSHEAGDDARVAARRSVRAVLAAIREPDEGMLVAGITAALAEDEPRIAALKADDFRVGAAVQIAIGDGRIHKSAWQAMLDAITKGEG